MQVVLNENYTDYDSSVSPKGQITLPLDARKKNDIKPKDKVLVRVFESGQIAVIPQTRSFLDHYKTVPALKKPLSFEEMRRIAYEERAEKVAYKHR
jgi:AbrB family looped-hinge helix DNA binding protein